MNDDILIDHAREKYKIKLSRLKTVETEKENLQKEEDHLKIVLQGLEEILKDCGVEIPNDSDKKGKEDILPNEKLMEYLRGSTAGQTIEEIQIGLQEKQKMNISRNTIRGRLEALIGENKVIQTNPEQKRNRRYGIQATSDNNISTT